MTPARWAIRRNHLGHWEVIAPDRESARSFPWAGSPKVWRQGRWAFPFASYWHAAKVLREHLDRERRRITAWRSGT